MNLVKKYAFPGIALAIFWQFFGVTVSEQNDNIITHIDYIRYIFKEIWIQKNIGTKNSPVKYGYKMNLAIGGIPLSASHATTRTRCVLQCRGHLQCRNATYWRNSSTCHLHSRASINGTFINDQAMSMDLQEGETHILIIGGMKYFDDYMADIIEFIPDTKTFQVLDGKLNEGSRYLHNAGLFAGQLIVDAGFRPPEYLTSTEVFNGVPLVENTNSAVIVSYQRAGGCGGIANNKFYSCFGFHEGVQLSHCDVYDLTEGNEYAYTRLETNLLATSVSCVFNGNDMYLLGGHTVLFTRTSKIFKINLETGGSTELQSYPETILHSASSVWYKGDIIVCGGRASISSGEDTTANCNKYGVSTDQWEPFPSLNFAREQHKLVNVVEIKYWPLGGGYPLAFYFHPLRYMRMAFGVCLLICHTIYLEWK